MYSLIRTRTHPRPLHSLLSARKPPCCHSRPHRATYSSGSPSPNAPPPEEFTKTGRKEQDPAKINSRSNEYSQSGGDEMVAAQQSASFDPNIDAASQKEVAGRGNAVNPLEFSPATPELSQYFERTEISKGVERTEGQHTGQGVTKKAKTVKKTKIDFK